MEIKDFAFEMIDAVRGGIQNNIDENVYIERENNIANAALAMVESNVS